MSRTPGTRIICEWCGKFIIGHRKRFCSRICHMTYLGNNQSDEKRKKLSESKKGENYYWYGKSPSEDTRLKISKANTGKTRTEESKRRISESKLGNKSRLGQPHSEETREAISKSVRESYDQDRPTQIRTEYQHIAYETYEYQCCICGKAQGKLSVHHLDGNHDNNDPDNLCWVCFKCHTDIHKGSKTLDKELTEIAKSSRVRKEDDIDE